MKKKKRKNLEGGDGGNNSNSSRSAIVSAAASKKKKSVVVGKVKKKVSVAVDASTAASTDSEGGGNSIIINNDKNKPAIRPTTRQSRGGGPRRSKHIVGRHTKKAGGVVTAADFESDSETENMDARGSVISPKKKKSNATASTPPTFNFATNGSRSVILPPVRRDLDGLSPIETRKCPVAGCDSSGHLGMNVV